MGGDHEGGMMIANLLALDHCSIFRDGRIDTGGNLASITASRR